MSAEQKQFVALLAGIGLYVLAVAAQLLLGWCLTGLLTDDRQILILLLALWSVAFATWGRCHIRRALDRRDDR